MSQTRHAKASFKPAVEALEERALMYGGPASPLADQAKLLLFSANNNYVFLETLPAFAQTHLGITKQVFLKNIGQTLVNEANLENAMRLLEHAEGFYEALGYDGRAFRAYDAYFHAYDSLVLQQAVADAVWSNYHFAKDGSIAFA